MILITDYLPTTRLGLRSSFTIAGNAKPPEGSASPKSSYHLGIYLARRLPQFILTSGSISLQFRRFFIAFHYRFMSIRMANSKTNNKNRLEENRLEAVLANLLGNLVPLRSKLKT